MAGHSLGGYVALLAASRDERIAPRPRDRRQERLDGGGRRVRRAVTRGRRSGSSPSARRSSGRLAKSVSPSALDPNELELLAERSIEQVEGGWRFRWDRRVLATEPVDPFAFLGRVRCPAHVIAGSESDVMPPGQGTPVRRCDPGRNGRDRRRRGPPRRARRSRARRRADPRLVRPDEGVQLRERVALEPVPLPGVAAIGASPELSVRQAGDETALEGDERVRHRGKRVREAAVRARPTRRHDVGRSAPEGRVRRAPRTGRCWPRRTRGPGRPDRPRPTTCSAGPGPRRRDASCRPRPHSTPLRRRRPRRPEPRRADATRASERPAALRAGGRARSRLDRSSA